jgi:hypothetical protein
MEHMVYSMVESHDISINHKIHHLRILVQPIVSGQPPGFEQLWGSEINENPRRFILKNCASATHHLGYWLVIYWLVMVDSG